MLSSTFQCRQCIPTRYAWQGNVSFVFQVLIRITLYVQMQMHFSWKNTWTRYLYVYIYIISYIYILKYKTEGSTADFVCPKLHTCKFSFPKWSSICYLQCQKRLRESRTLKLAVALEYRHYWIQQSDSCTKILTTCDTPKIQPTRDLYFYAVP